MSDKTTELEKDLKHGLETLQTLRDEVRLKLHLANMEVKDQWKKLEPRLAEIEGAAANITEASRTAVTDAVHSLKKLRDSMS